MSKKFPIKAIVSIFCVAIPTLVGIVLVVNDSFKPENTHERNLSELAFDDLDTLELGQISCER